MSAINSSLSRQLAVQRPIACETLPTLRVTSGLFGQPLRSRDVRPPTACCQQTRGIILGGYVNKGFYHGPPEEFYRGTAGIFEYVNGRRTNLHARREGEKGRPHPFIVEQTASEFLVEALKYRGFDIDIPDGPRYSGLSHVKPSHRRPGILPRPREGQPIKVVPPSRPYLPSILAEYILRIHKPRSIPRPLGYEDGQSKATSEVFDLETLSCLWKRGYSAKDVVAWAPIITAPTGVEAARLLFEYDEQYEDTRTRAPLFLLLFVLRRRNLNRFALRKLLFLSWQKLACGHGPWNPRGDETSMMILIIRLMRHARELWPEALPSIATMMTTYIGKWARHPDDPKFNPYTVQRLTFAYNRGLKLLSMPCRINPYDSIRFQQRAQFQLLRRMTQFDPPIVVTQEGYQAVTSVQLAHKKTATEEEWAKFKAVSWPPWKEEKLGIDSERGNEGRKSRAMEPLSQMVAAGYSHGQWEKIATVYAGWDTDGTPTIQKRVTMIPPKGPERSNHDEVEGPDLWAARIRATRTLKEAWACFLSYEDQNPPHQKIYDAMCEKIILRAHTKDESLLGHDAPLPGDGKEVFPEPSSPRDVIYTRSEPPTVEALFDQMRSHGLVPSPRFLARLLSSTYSFRKGMEYLLSSNLPREMIDFFRALFTDELKIFENIPTDVPNYVFTSCVQFLCNVSEAETFTEDSNVSLPQAFPIAFSKKAPVKAVDHPPTVKTSPKPRRPRRPRALEGAAKMLREQNFVGTPPWGVLLSRLAGPRIPASARGLYPVEERVLGWYEIVEVLGWIDKAGDDLDFNSFQILCDAFTRAVLKARNDVEATRKTLVSLGGPDRTFEDMVHSGIEVIKRHFYQIVLPDDAAATETAFYNDHIHPEYLLPQMGVMPKPATLHSFVRVLGITKDFDGILRLLRWMGGSAMELKEKSNQHRSGDRHLRRTIVGIRAFLLDCWEERPAPGSRFSPLDESGHERYKGGKASDREMMRKLREEMEEESSPPTFSDPKLQEAYDIIESAKGVWGPWPSDQDVALYVWEWKFDKDYSK
ncbi:hypothetical protein FQN54_004876 [Arachnomyces sp. PD_36]|nr:hypothetical protein FQN54_004876 [Arachnomyces sp. PD_36]